MIRKALLLFALPHSNYYNIPIEDHEFELKLWNVRLCIVPTPQYLILSIQQHEFIPCLLIRSTFLSFELYQFCSILTHTDEDSCDLCNTPLQYTNIFYRSMSYATAIHKYILQIYVIRHCNTQIYSTDLCNTPLQYTNIFYRSM